mmetsp:Transcript_45855/g.149082  ORF Transcript_45855/g.149082 Transcript_45855/m.149082 type:complete len:230 (-) Transcript_45855:67-756(-)
MRTQEMVFAPTPLYEPSTRFTSSSDASRRCSSEHSPRSSCRSWRMACTRAVFVSARPQLLITASMAAGGDMRTISHVGKACLRAAKLRCDWTSVVFCDRIVPTRASSTRCREPQAPSSCFGLLSSSITSGWSSDSAWCTARASASDGERCVGKGPAPVADAGDAACFLQLLFERLVATAASSATLSGLTTTDSVARARFLGMSLEAVGEGGSRRRSRSGRCRRRRCGGR